MKTKNCWETFFFLPVLFAMLAVWSSAVFAKDRLQPAITQEIPLADLPSFSEYPSKVKELILKANQLTQKNLTYLYGSADPKNKGMDCSGTIYYLLTQSKLDNVPRSSNDLFLWLKQHGKLHLVKDKSLESIEFSSLHPGDLLFWSGTYKTNSAISHVMLYLGKNKQHKDIMFGASDGRYYQGKKMWGVSVFDFEMPNGKTSARFVGYGCIPKMTCEP